MDEVGDIGESSAEHVPAYPDPSTTYCSFESCGTLRRIVKVTDSHKIPVLERVKIRTASGSFWEETDRFAYERKVRLECEHPKGVIGV